MLGSFNNMNDQIKRAFAFLQCNEAELLLCLVDPLDCLKLRLVYIALTGLGMAVLCPRCKQNALLCLSVDVHSSTHCTTTFLADCIDSVSSIGSSQC